MGSETFSAKGVHVLHVFGLQPKDLEPEPLAVLLSGYG